jgi:hypothetical protein
MSVFLPPGEQTPADRQGLLRMDSDPSMRQISNVHLMSASAKYLIQRKCWHSQGYRHDIHWLGSKKELAAAL